jgi:glycosyltransferase 2 family protein
MLLKVAISAGVIAWAFSRVPLAEVSGQFAEARPGYLLAGLAVFGLAILVDATKWQVLLRAQGVVLSRATVLRYQLIGFFFNNFLPSSGDVVRVYGLARLTDRPADAAISVLLDRILGFLAYMSSAVVASFLAASLVGSEALRQVQAVAILAALAIVVALGLLLSRRLRAVITAILGWRRLAVLSGPWEQISHALDAYHLRSRALRIAFGIAFLGILCTATVNWLVSQAMGGQMALPIIVLFNPLIALALMLPISIGGLGVSQAAYPFFYGMVGVGADHALAVSLFMQLTQLLAGLPGGLLWLRMRRTAQAPAPAQTEALQ